eukprot:scaffold186090_cov34-Tisochrysis_lutea.AAC.4
MMLNEGGRQRGVGKGRKGVLRAAVRSLHRQRSPYSAIRVCTVDVWLVRCMWLVARDASQQDALCTRLRFQTRKEGGTTSSRFI